MLRVSCAVAALWHRHEQRFTFNMQNARCRGPSMQGIELPLWTGRPKSPMPREEESASDHHQTDAKSDPDSQRAHA